MIHIMKLLNLNFINCLDKNVLLQNLSNYVDGQYQEGKESVKEILNHHISYEYHLIKVFY